MLLTLVKIHCDMFLKIAFCLLFIVALTGCDPHKKFNREQWNYGDGLEFPLRNEIVDDLVKNHQLKGLNYGQVIDTLGIPQKRDSLLLAYQILDNSSDFSRKKPAHIKSLVLHFSKDSVVVKAEIKEYDNKK